MSSGTVRVNSVRFNQDNTRFACGLDNGFALFNSNPLKQILHVDLDESIGLVEPLFRCNVLALLGSGVSPTFDANKVIIFDCSVHKTVVELDVRLPVTNVLLRRDRIIAATEERILVYSLNDIPEHLLTVETAQNPLGLCAISHTDVNSVLIFPSKSIGHIGVLSLSHPQRRLKVFRAHNHDIQAISVNLNGTLIATASIKGTLIHLFDAQTTSLVREFRRGISNSIISCIKFSMDSTAVCVASNHKTVHVFNVKDKAEQQQSLFERYFNQRPAYIRLYTQSINDANSNTQCAFVGNGCSVTVIDLNTRYYKFDIDIDHLKCLHWTNKLFMSEDGKAAD